MTGEVSVLEEETARLECRVDAFPRPYTRVSWTHNNRPVSPGRVTALVPDFLEFGLPFVALFTFKFRLYSRNSLVLSSNIYLARLHAVDFLSSVWFYVGSLYMYFTFQSASSFRKLLSLWLIWLFGFRGPLVRDFWFNLPSLWTLATRRHVERSVAT